MFNEYDNVRNPMLGAYLLWNFVLGYYSEKNEYPPIEELFIVLPMIMKNDIADQVKSTNRASGMRGMSDKFMKADVLKNDIICNLHMTSLSHDVRTPLTTLIGYLDAAHKGLVTGKDRDDYIETARRKAHDLKEYIDVLFDWFKLNSNEFALEIQSVEAAELTRNILIDWIPIFEDKQVEYDIDIPEQPVRVRLDMDSYMRIVNNLIQNVIAHSHADKIKIALSKKENNMELLLADNGVGIEKEDLKHIFERLYKCDKGRSEKGSGLGLSIVHQLVEKMDGNITVESLPGKGTEFMLLFPLES